MNIQVLDLNPKGRYSDGRPFYSFHNPFPREPVVLPELFASAEDAYKHGRKYVIAYEKSSFPGGMGAVLGVVNTAGEYQAVIVTYYSNS